MGSEFSIKVDWAPTLELFRRAAVSDATWEVIAAAIVSQLGTTQADHTQALDALIARLRSFGLADGSIALFDASGRFESWTDPAGNVTTASCDAGGLRAGLDGPQGNALAFARDGAGHVASVTSETGEEVTFTLDASGTSPQRPAPAGLQPSATTRPASACGWRPMTATGTTAAMPPAS